MLGRNSGIVRRYLGLAASMLLMAGVVACAASKGGAPSEPKAMGSGFKVSVETLGGSTVVSLEGLVQPVFTAFAQQNPDRVVVDLASVPPVEPMEPVTVQDGLVEQVSVSAFATGIGDAMTRVEVLLTVPADFNVVTHENGLSVEVVPLMGSAGAGEFGEDTLGDDPWAMEAEGPTEPEPLITWNAPDATRLLGVDVEDTGDGALIHLRGDGSITSAVTFTLEDPARLVVDLPDMVNEIEKGSIDVDLPQARRVRVGQHAGMVRVVIDAGEATAPFESRTIIPAPDGLAIALGDGESMDAAIAVIGIYAPLFDEPEAFDLEGQETGAPEMAGVPGGDESSVEGSEADWAEMGDGEWPAATDGDVWEEEANGGEGFAQADDAAPTDELDRIETGEGILVTIYGVEFDNQAERDRIVIVGDRPVDYVVYEPNPETMVLSFSNAEIDPAAEVRIAPEVSGPVSLVTAFSQPDTESPEVRVVVQRASGLMPDITRRGPMLFVDFPRTATASRPPILLVEPGALEDSEADWVAEETFFEDPGLESVPEFVPDATEARDAPVVAAVGVPERGGRSVSDLPPIPASIMPETMGGGAPPASLEPPAAIDLLQEGGLVNGKEYIGRRISLDFKEVDIADVLRLIAEVSDLNVIAGDEVKGNVTIRLVDVPWDQALDVILLTKNLGFMRIGNVLRVAPAGVIKSEEESRLQERRAKEKLEDLVVKLQPVNYANVTDISAMVQRLLSARGTVNTDTRTNTLIIKDIPSVVDEATALVKAIDTQTPQVMIEAKIVEASLDFSREFGSVWSVGSQPLIDGFNSGSGVRNDLGGSQFRLRDANNFSSLNPITAGPTALANLGAFLLDERINLDVQLQAAEVNGDGKVISSPRIVTLDNSEAKIEQGVSIPFQTFENGDAALEFVDAVLSLKVKPHITADRSIIMEIMVSRNAPDDSVFTLTGSPAIAKNQVKTEALVKDGRTLVLGGIYVVDKSQRQSRVPYLHKIPILGAAFRSDEISDSRKELLIFVTPTIITTTPIRGS